MKTKLLITILLCFGSCFALLAQERPVLDSLPSTSLDSFGFPITAPEFDINEDSLFQIMEESAALLDTSIVDSLSLGMASDSLSVQTFTSTSTVAYSKDSLDQEVESFGRDSMLYDIANKEIHLWGEAYVTYGEIKLEADYIVYNWVDNIVTASFRQDSSGVKTGLPKFTDATQDFTAKKMRFNFKTKKGVVLEAVSVYNGMNVLGGKTKFFGEDSDSLDQHQHIYSKNAVFTTCNHPEPHFGIRSTKQKVVPNKVVVVGPSNIELGGVPTPIWLPFGFFPLKLGERTGLIFPRNYEYSDRLGYGLRGVGWYFPINDYVNLTVTGDIYTRGTWGLSARSQYKKRYKYNGSLSLNFSDQRVERGIDIVSDKSFSAVWSHSQDAKAHPTLKFSGGLDFQTNNYQSRNFNDAESVQQNNTRSNINLTKTFSDKPFTLTASVNHSQNTNSREVTVNLPNLTFVTRRIAPFESKDPNADEKWYDKIGFTYRGEAKNTFKAADTTVFTQQTLTDARFGAKHRVSTDASFRILKYINVNPSASYTEVWHFKTLDRVFDPTPVIDTIVIDSTDGVIVYDTTQYGTVIDQTNTGFEPLRLFNAGVSMNTKLFGTMLFKRGPIRGIRHIATPNIGINYTPDYTTDTWDYFRKVQNSNELNVDNEDFDTQFDTYSIFQGGVYSDQPSSSGQQLNLTYGVTNNFEGKYYSKKDSTEQRFKIFDSVNLNGSYNLAADTLNWNTIRVNSRATIIPSITNFVFTATFDPYLTENNRRVEEFVWDDRKRLARFVNANATLRTRFTVKKLAEMISGNKSNNKRPKAGGPKGVKNESFLSLIENFSISHDIKFDLRSIGEGTLERDTFSITTHSITVRGNLQITDKMRINLSQLSYDIKRKNLVYPSITISRDLHCWQMSIGWWPDRNVFSFSLGVKPGALDFIKVPYGRNQFDGVGGAGFQ
ncbi:MAG: putative LPS assembly protein LptD [Saprospiraceae bacterium]